MGLEADYFGPYWTCLQCGHNLMPRVPPIQALAVGLTEAIMRRAA
jgi:hypothetical protein